MAVNLSAIAELGRWCAIAALVLAMVYAAAVFPSARSERIGWWLVAAAALVALCCVPGLIGSLLVLL